MTTFYCPKCKARISDTKYCKIYDGGCSKCRTKLVKMVTLTKSISKQEDELNKQYQNIPKGLYSR